MNCHATQELAMGCTPSKGSSASSRKSLRPVTEPAADYLSQKFSLGAAISCSVISEDLSMLVAGSEDGSLSVWSSMSNPAELLAELKGHKANVTCISIMPNYLISGSADSLIVKWSLVHMSAIYIYCGHEAKISDILCVGNYLFSSSYDRTIKLWYLDLPAAVPENQKQEVCLIWTFRGHEKGVYPLAFIPAGNNWDLERQISARDSLISGSADCTVRIWSLSLKLCLKVLEGHSAPVHKIAVDRETRQVFTAGGDGLIISWDVITGDILRYLNGHTAAVLSLTVHKKMLFSASADRTARAWVMEFGEETRVFRGSQSGVTCFQYFEGMVYMGSADGTSRAFDAKSGSLKRVFRGPPAPITSLQCSDGKLFTTQADGTLLIWDTSGLREETVFGSDPALGSEEDSDYEEDSIQVREAIEMLETYLAPKIVIY